MKTITVQIGNSDNKLTQTEWADFVHQVGKAIAELCLKTHFFGGCCNWSAWQNVTWVFECDEITLALLIHDLKEIRARFRQDSVAVTTGETSFV